MSPMNDPMISHHLPEGRFPPAGGGVRSSARAALAEASWLAGVHPATLDALAAQAVLHRVPPGSLLFDHAEAPNFAQFLLAGSIELLGVRGEAETLIELLQPVDMVIPAAVISGLPYLMRARVHEEAHLLLVRAEAFREALAADASLCLAVLYCQAAQFRRQVRHAKNLKLRSAEERVGCYLVDMFADQEKDFSIRLPMEKRLIASQLGMTRETFSRALSSMSRFAMRVDGDLVHVLDAAPARARFLLDPLIDRREPIGFQPQRKP